MLRKAKAELGSKPIEQAKELSQAILNSSHQIWLAGLGAFARAQQEGMRVFETLVKQGESLEKTTRQAAAETAAAARGAAKAKAKEMQEMAGGTWDKLEQVFEERVARALSKLGVYTQNDVQRLADRVDELAARVDQLLKTTGGRGGARARTARETPPRKAKAETAAPKAPAKTRRRKGSDPKPKT
jgi:poly(hydroxyalkanoate) granule-associated protein